jgi:HEAT repeat protein
MSLLLVATTIVVAVCSTSCLAVVAVRIVRGRRLRPTPMIEAPLPESGTDGSRDAWSVESLLADARAPRGRTSKRITALGRLVQLRHPQAFELLRLAVLSRHPDLVEAAVSLLGRLGDRSAANVLIEILGTDACPASRVASELDHFALPIAEDLCALTRTTAPEVRFWAATLLVRYAGQPQVEESLARLVDDDDPTVRKAAVQALGAMKSSLVPAVATALLTDPIFFVRAHAIRALAATGEPEHAEAIARGLGDASRWVRLAAKDALVAMGPGAEPALILPLTLGDEVVRRGAIEVMHDLGLLRAWMRRAAVDDTAGDTIDLVAHVLPAAFDEVEA